MLSYTTVDEARLSAAKILEQVSSLLMLHCEDVVDGVKVLLKQNDFLRDRASQLEDDKNSLLRKLAVSQIDDVVKGCTDSRTCNNVLTNSAHYEDVFEIFGCKAESVPQHNAVNGEKCTTINAGGPGTDNNAGFYHHVNPTTTVVKTVYFDATAPASHTATTTARAVAASSAKLPRCIELVDERWDYSMECDSASDEGSVVGDKSVPKDFTIPMRNSQCSATARKTVLPSSVDCVSKSSVGSNTAVNDVTKSHKGETQRNSTMEDSNECICSGNECDIYRDCDDFEASSTAQPISVTNNATSLVF